MTKPTDDITWATDATYAADGDAWSGDANKVDPGATRRAEGAEPDTFPAVWYNFVLNGIGNVLTWILARFDSTGQVLLETATIFQRYQSALSCDLPGSWTVSPTGVPGAGGHLLSTANSAVAWWDASKSLPRGASIVRISALVTPGIARATAGNRMSISLYQEDYGLSTAPVVGATLLNASDATGTGVVNDDGTNNAQWITLDFTGAPVSVTDAMSWTLVVTAGSDAATNQDMIHAVLVEFQTTLVSND